MSEHTHLLLQILCCLYRPKNLEDTIANLQKKSKLAVETGMRDICFETYPSLVLHLGLGFNLCFVCCIEKLMTIAHTCQLASMHDCVEVPFQHQV